MNNTQLTNKQNHNYSLQILRGIAALMVVMQHIKVYTNIIGNNPSSVYNYVPQIFGLGAPLFFCISGFVMALLINNNSNKFLYKRFLRIYPPFLIASILVIFARALFLGDSSYNKLFRALALIPLGITPTYPLNIEWTLIYEVFFYIVCSIFTLRYCKRFFLPFLIAWAFVISLAIYAFGVPSEMLTTIKLIPFSKYNYFFIIGALVYYIYKSRKIISAKINYTMIFLTTITLLVFYYFILGRSPFLMNFNFLIFAILFGAILYFTVNIQAKPSTALVKIGDYSYGIYLIHAQTMFIVLTLWSKIFPINELASTFTLIITLIVSWNFGKFEYKLHKKLRTLQMPTFKRNQIISSLSVCLLLISFVAFQYAYSFNQKSKEVVVAFESTNVILEELSAGWVDSTSDLNVSNNPDITFYGWAIDPYITAPATNVILVSGENILPSKIVWYERTGLTEVFKTDSVLMSGFTLTVNSKHLDVGENNLEIYAVTKDNKYIPLQVESPIVINKK